MISIEFFNKTRTKINGLSLRRLLVPAFNMLVKEGRINKNDDWNLEISFVGEKAITRLSTHYYKKPQLTDVISLSYFEEAFKKNNVEQLKGGLAGEIFICVPYALNQAKKIGQSLNEELKFLFIHGLLHVFGYDHKKPEDEKKMFGLTYKILNRKNPPSN